MKLKRMRRADRREQIIKAAVLAATELGYNAITQTDVYMRVGCSRSSIYAHFPDFEVLREEVMRRAVARNIPQILAVGIALRDPRAMTVDRERVLEFMS